MDQREYEFPPEAGCALFILVACLFIFVCWQLGKPSWEASARQIDEYSTQRKAWEVDCLKKGKILHLSGKGSPDDLCLSADGRILGSR